jgi:hypothetical protein
VLVEPPDEVAGEDESVDDPQPVATAMDTTPAMTSPRARFTNPLGVSRR